jgi:hypothetical protein
MGEKMSKLMVRGKGKRERRREREKEVDEWKEREKGETREGQGKLPIGGGVGETNKSKYFWKSVKSILIFP